MSFAGVNVGFLMYQARRWAILVVAPAIVVAALAFLYVHREPKTYQATVSLSVQTAPGAAVSGGAQDVTGAVQLAQSYAELATNPAVTSVANTILAPTYPGYHVQTHNLQATVPGGATPSGPYVYISVNDTVPTRALAAANAVGTALVKQIQSADSAKFSQDQQDLERQLLAAEQNQKQPGEAAVVQGLVNQLTQFKILRDVYLNNIIQLPGATAPHNPIGPAPLRSAGLYGFLALMLFGGFLLLYDFIRDLPRSPDEVAQLVGAPILGNVPRFAPKGQRLGLVATRGAHSPEAETYRLIRTNIQFTNVDTPPRSIVVTSSFPREGKTTTASNLASVLAAGDQQVLLVDADLRRPTLHDIFETDRQDGLTLLLMANRYNGQGVRDTEMPNLHLVAAGPIPPNPADLLGSQRMRNVMEHFRQEADIVVFDSPPVLAVSDAAILSTMTDGVVLVVDPSKTKRRELRRSRQSIEAVGGKILGVVLNRLGQGSGPYYYYYSHYGPQGRGKKKANRSKTPRAPIEGLRLPDSASD